MELSLPPTAPPTATPSKQAHFASSMHNQDKLPMLTNMHAIAMVTVDTEQEKFKVHKFKDDTPQVQSPNAKQSVPRSKSLLTLRCECVCVCGLYA